MPTIGDLYRHFTVVVNNGSGCIFQPSAGDYTYIFTVKHNLIIDKEINDYKKEDIKVSRNYEAYTKNIFLPVTNVFIHPDKDCAIVQVAKVTNEEESKLKIGKLKRGSEACMHFGLSQLCAEESDT